jgi:hypothetical protein
MLRQIPRFSPIVIHLLSPKPKTKKMAVIVLHKNFLVVSGMAANGLRYLRWSGDGEAVQLEK